MQVTEVVEEGSVRVDLVGGTLDLYPINLILPGVVTCNVATSLKAKVSIRSHEGQLMLKSMDYETSQSIDSEQFQGKSDEINWDEFGALGFLAILCHQFGLRDNAIVETLSGSPPGAGLGGSSALGITVGKAINRFLNLGLSTDQIFKKVKDIEAQILGQGVPGYQDYLPAIHGGVLAIHAQPGENKVEQLYSPELAKVLESHALLVYSGKTRKSGINNWEVYKGFFDGEKAVQEGLSQLNSVAKDFYRWLKEGSWDRLPHAMAREGEVRGSLFEGIETQEVRKLKGELKTLSGFIGIKICGAGGGGCFLVLHDGHCADQIEKVVQKNNMRVLPFQIETPVLGESA